MSYIYPVQKARKYELYNSLEKMVYEDVIPTATNFLHNMFALLINSTILILINGVVFCYILSGTTDSQCYFLTAKLSNVTKHIVLSYIYKSKTNIEQLNVKIHSQK